MALLNSRYQPLELSRKPYSLLMTFHTKFGCCSLMSGGGRRKTSLSMSIPCKKAPVKSSDFIFHLFCAALVIRSLSACLETVGESVLTSPTSLSPLAQSLAFTLSGLLTSFWTIFHVVGKIFAFCSELKLWKSTSLNVPNFLRVLSSFSLAFRTRSVLWRSKGTCTTH